MEMRPGSPPGIRDERRPRQPGRPRSVKMLETRRPRAGRRWHGLSPRLMSVISAGVVSNVLEYPNSAGSIHSFYAL